MKSQKKAAMLRLACHVKHIKEQYLVQPLLSSYPVSTVLNA